MLTVLATENVTIIQNRPYIIADTPTVVQNEKANVLQHGGLTTAETPISFMSEQVATAYNQTVIQNRQVTTPDCENQIVVQNHGLVTEDSKTCAV